MPPKDMETHNNLLLLRVMKELGCPLWYALRYPLWNTTDSTATDLPLWTVISQQTRLKRVWCQENWFILRKLYLDGRRAELSSQLATDSLFLQTYREHMMFLESNAEQWTQLLLEPSTTSPPINQTELKSCIPTHDSNSRATSVDSTNLLQKLIHNDSETPQHLSLPSSCSEIDTGKVVPLDDKEKMCTSASPNTITKAGSKRPRSDLWETVVLKKPSNSCVDTAFGEWVTARLLKMNRDENQQAKKEIIDILL